MNKLRFLVSLIMQNNAYQRQQAVAAKDAARQLGVDAEILFADNDALTQGRQLLSVIRSSHSRPDGIICHPVGTMLVRIAHCAAEAGIAWAVLNRDCDYTSELRSKHSVPIFSVSVDQAEIGRLQGRQIAALLPEGGLTLYILGPSASPIAAYRQSLMQASKPATVQVRTLWGDWSEQSAYRAVTSWLRLSTAMSAPLKLVAAQCDDMAMGARRAFEDHPDKQERKRWTSLPYIGCDGCPDAGQEWVRRNLLSATVVSPPTAGIALKMMMQALRSKTQPSERTLVVPSSFPAIVKIAETAGTINRSHAANPRVGH